MSDLANNKLYKFLKIYNNTLFWTCKYKPEIQNLESLCMLNGFDQLDLAFSVRLLKIWFVKTIRHTREEKSGWFVLSVCFTFESSEFNKFESRLKSGKIRFQLSAGLNLEKFNTNLSESNKIWAAA